jgi:hypothetical protein
VECDFLHRNEELGISAAARATPTPALRGAMLPLKDGTSVRLAELAPTQGLAFALVHPGKSRLCRNRPCPLGVECDFLHLRSTPATKLSALDASDLKRVRAVLWDLYREISRQLDKCNSSEALVAELLNLHEDVAHRVAGMDMQLARLSTINVSSREASMADLAVKKHQ